MFDVSSVLWICDISRAFQLSQNMKAIREEDESPIAQFFSKTQSQASAPSWSEEFEICLPTDIEDEERAEVLEIKFYHQSGGVLKASKQDQDSDQVIGSCVIPLRKFVKFVTLVRYPDGSEDPPYFNGECSKWFKLCDDNGHPVKGSFVEDPAEAQIQLTYKDPMKKKTVIDSRAMLLPQYPYQEPVCKVPLARSSCALNPSMLCAILHHYNHTNICLLKSMSTAS